MDGYVGFPDVRTDQVHSAPLSKGVEPMLSFFETIDIFFRVPGANTVRRCKPWTVSRMP